MATALALGAVQSPAAALAAAVFGPWSPLAASLLAAGWLYRAAARPDGRAAAPRRQNAPSRRRRAGAV